MSCIPISVLNRRSKFSTTFSAQHYFRHFMMLDLIWTKWRGQNVLTEITPELQMTIRSLICKIYSLCISIYFTPRRPIRNVTLRYTAITAKKLPKIFKIVTDFLYGSEKAEIDRKISRYFHKEGLNQFIFN